AERAHQIQTQARALGAAAAEAYAVVLDAEAQMTAGLLQAHADRARAAIRKGVLDGVRHQLVDNEAERNGLGDGQAAAHRGTFDGKRLAAGDQRLEVVAQLLKEALGVERY